MCRPTRSDSDRVGTFCIPKEVVEAMKHETGQEMCDSACRYYATASDFYRCVSDAVADSSDVMASYRIFHKVLSQAVAQKVEFERLKLPGLFAKINHLAQEYALPDSLQRSVNDVRIRLRRLFDNDNKQGCTREQEKELHKYLLHDMKAICSFIEAVYAEPVPLSLRELYPRRARKSVAVTRKSDCVRVMVNKWDEEYIYVVDDSSEPVERKVCYTDKNQYLQGGDWTYIVPLLKERMQLNLVAVRIVDDVWMPELIILEPDVLVDVSSIAACLEHYGDSPYTYLLNRLKPNESSEPMILGNFASLLLDNALLPEDKRRGYKDCAVEFFQRNALQISTSELSDGFHAEAKRQFDNINSLLSGEGLAEVGALNQSLAITEPSFFCEPLGLQGRMDFLQLDYSVLMEQKSGKGAFPPNPDPEVPNPQTKHYAQMIMYMAILHYNFGKKNANAYLLYSKYSKGLLGLGPAPLLLFRSIQMRNRIVWMEKEMAQTDLAERILRGITAESLNVDKVRGVLWERYTKPQIEGLLNPIKCASQLEQAYFFRMLRFVMTEHLLGKIGSPSRDGSGFASKWHETLEEKVMSGSIYSNLHIASIDEDCSESVEVLELRADQAVSADATNFRKGDIVVLYAYKSGEVPDLRRTMVFRCSIEDITTETVVLRLRSPQSNAKVFFMQQGDVWCIEHDYFESSVTSLMRGLYSFLTTAQDRRDLLLLQREPRIDRDKCLRGDYGERFNDLMLRVKQASDFFLIVGPPGTGKTSYGMLNTLKEELTDPDSSVLLLSYTNRAVDEICSKLIHEDIDFIRVGGALSCSEECRGHLLESKVRGITNKDELRRLLKSVCVYAGTTSSINAHSELFKLKRFSLAIVDEASQILEPHIIGLLSVLTDGAPSIRKFVFIGDHKQLPAVVQQDAEESVVAEPLLHEIGLDDCRLSLFERLYNRHKANPLLCHMLTSHGRMHEEIASFPNEMFYQKRLSVVPLPHQVTSLNGTSGDLTIDKLVDSVRVAFVNVPSSGSSLSDRVNMPEADVIAQIAFSAYRKYSSSFDANETIGVIVPYRNQIAAVRNALAKYGIPDLTRISIDTVERYQGSQRKVIIYGFTIRQRYQLNFLCSNTFVEDGALIDRKLNVAMTRAMEHLYLVGNAALLSESPVFSQLIDYAKNEGGYVSPQP